MSDLIFCSTNAVSSTKDSPVTFEYKRVKDQIEYEDNEHLNVFQFRMEWRFHILPRENEQMY